MRTIFIVNAGSGRKRDREALMKLIEATTRGETCQIHLTQNRGELDDIFAGDFFRDCDVVYAVGGDGTVNEIGRRLIGTGKALGILPSGSGNGFARHLHIPLNAATALEARKRSVIVGIDTASVNGIPFLGTFGIGFDAIVASRFAEAGTRGIETYLRQAAVTFMSFAAEEYEFEVDGKSFRESAILATVANSSQYGNEAKIAPQASLRDGLLDLVIVRQSRLIDSADLIRRLFFGTLRDCSYLRTKKAKHVRILRQAEGAAHIDGDPLVLGKELDILIHEQSLNVLIPKRTMRGI